MFAISKAPDQRRSTVLSLLLQLGFPCLAQLIDIDPICIAPPKEAKRSGDLVAIGDGFEKKTANVDEPAALAVMPALLAWSGWRISVVYLFIRCLW